MDVLSLSVLVAFGGNDAFGQVLGYEFVGKAGPGNVVAFVDGFKPGVRYGVASGGMIVLNEGEIGVLVLNGMGLVGWGG